MYHSVFIASLLGPLFLSNAVAMMVNRKGYQEMVAGAVRNPAVIYMSGGLSLLIGLAIVQMNNPGTMNNSSMGNSALPMIVTALGWLSVVGGVARIVFPEQVANLGQRMMTSRGMMVAGGIVTGLLGAFLTFKGYQLPTQ